jgi:FXSXX-COOH protein
MTIVDKMTSPDSVPPVFSVLSVLPDLGDIPLGEMPSAAVSKTLDRLLPPVEASVPVAAFNSSI